MLRQRYLETIGDQEDEQVWNGVEEADHSYSSRERHSSEQQ